MTATNERERETLAQRYERELARLDQRSRRLSNLKDEVGFIRYVVEVGDPALFALSNGDDETPRSDLPKV